MRQDTDDEVCSTYQGRLKAFLEHSIVAVNHRGTLSMIMRWVGNYFFEIVSFAAITSNAVIISLLFLAPCCGYFTSAESAEI